MRARLGYFVTSVTEGETSINCPVCFDFFFSDNGYNYRYEPLGRSRTAIMGCLTFELLAVTGIEMYASV